MRAILYLFLSTVPLICNGLRVLGPSGPLTVQPGGSVMLPCFVDTPIPVEELTVEWRRTDSDTVVLVFRDGESRAELQDQEYHDRARLFTEEVTHGNFSLLLTDVTVKHTGVYKCVIYRNQESNETMVEIKMGEFLIVSGGHVVSAHVGEDITLTCSVHSHIPPEKLQRVSWQKIDGDMVVLLIVWDQIKPGSTNEKYKDRVELFNPEEIKKGNFSLRLQNFQSEDKGLYICDALHEALSASTTVEVLQLGLFTVHIAVLFLCTCVCLCGISLLLVCIPWPSFNMNHMIKIQHGLVFCPNVIMFLAFILWGQLDGFFSEVAVGAAINLLRIFQLLNFTPCINSFQGDIQWTIKKATALECSLFTVVVYLVLWHVSSAEYRIILVIVGIAVLVVFTVFVLVIALQRIFPSFIFVCLGYLYIITLGFLLGLSLVSVAFLIQLGGPEKHKLGLIFMNILFFILTALAYTIIWFSGSERTQKPLVPFSRLCMCGVAVLFLMNSITLSVELVLSARIGKRTIKDLQVILLPFEWVVAMGYIVALVVMQLQRPAGSVPSQCDDQTSTASSPIMLDTPA